VKRLVVALLCVAAPAFAENKADALFKKGKELLAKKKYAEACATFEKVDALDPAIGAKLNVAKCFEEWGKLARAYNWYRDAEKMAKDTNDKRVDKIHELVAALDPDVPRLTLKAPEDADTAAANVLLDGKPVTTFNVEMRIDPGPHQIEYIGSAGKKTRAFPLERGGSAEVPLDLPKGIAQKLDKKTPAPAVAATETPAGRGQRIAGLVAIGVGVAGLSVGSYLALDARTNYKRALEQHCANDKTMCDDDGIAITAQARKQANHATLWMFAGAAVVTGGIALYLLAPKLGKERAAYIAPTTNGIALGGVF
jgi:tetratricopeptide (TPR) repeat protein